MRSENRPLAVVAILLAVSILITGALAVRLMLARRSEEAGQATMLAEARIAFVSAREEQGAVYVMDADGSDLNQISGSNQFALFPAWSPDGERVAYLVFERMGRAGQVWVAAADGSERVQVAEAGSSTYTLAWSPDGTRLAFVTVDSRGGDAPDSVVHVARIDGSGVERELSLQGLGIIDLAWSPDGERMLFAAGSPNSPAGVYTMSSDGTNVTQVFSGTQAADWSPSGEEVAVAAGAQDAIFALGGDQTPREMAYIDEGWPEQLAWSPDGRHLAVITGQEETVALQVAVVETGAITTVLEREGALTWPSWSPDGERLLFTSIEPGRRQDSYLPYGELWQYTVSTGELEELVVGEGFDGLGVWSP